MNVDSSLAKCRMASAISSGSAARFRRFLDLQIANVSSGTLAGILVLMRPGHTAFTRMPSRAWSAAMQRTDSDNAVLGHVIGYLPFLTNHSRR